MKLPYLRNWIIDEAIRVMSSFAPSLHPMDYTGPGVPPLDLNQNPWDPYESQIPPSQSDEPEPRNPVPSISEARKNRERDQTPSPQGIPPKHSPPPQRLPKRGRDEESHDGQPSAKRVMGTVIIFNHFVPYTPTHQIAPPFPDSPPLLHGKEKLPRSNVEKLEPEKKPRIPPDLYGFRY